MAGLRSEGISYIFAGDTELDLSLTLDILNRELGVKRAAAIRKVMHGTSLEHQIVKWKSASSLRGAQATKQSSKPFNPPELLRGAGPVGLR